MNNNEMIAVKQLPIIEEQLHQIKADVLAKTEEALSLVCTEETVQTIKKKRAELNKELAFWEDKRKEVKTAVMSPYNKFEAVYKECITDVFRKADTELKDKINSVENELKEQKRKEVTEYFEEYRQSKNIDFVTFANSGINVTLSASLKGLKEQAKAFLDRISDDLNLIDSQEHKDEILYEYKNSLNVSAAITTVVNRFKAIEEAKAREEERKRREEALKEAAAKVEKVTEPLTPPVVETVAPPIVEEPVLTLRFTVKATRAKLKELKEFLERNGYIYE